MNKTKDLQLHQFQVELEQIVDLNLAADEIILISDDAENVPKQLDSVDAMAAELA